MRSGFNIHPRRRRDRAFSALAGMVTMGFAIGGNVAQPLAETQSVPVQIVIEGPPGPYPYGHAEYRVTVYEGALADAPPELTNIAVAAEMRPVLSFPETIKIDVAAERLAKSIRPMVSVVISSGRRPSFVSDVATPLDRNGPTRVRVDVIP